MALLCIREESGFKSLGIGLHWFLDAVRVRIVNCSNELTGDGTVTEKVDSIPLKYTVKIDVGDVWKEVKWQVPETVIEGIDWDAVKRACTPQELLKIKKAKPPAFGTLPYAHRFSSSLPATSVPLGFQLRTSELYAAGHVNIEFNGVFTTRPLPKGFYVGEYLGKVVPISRVTAHRTPYFINIQSHDTHDSNGDKIPDCFRDSRPVCVLFAEDEATSSFIKYVNTPTLWPGLFPASKIGRLEPHRPGLVNCEFVQIQRRIYLVTSKKVPPGKELLAHQGDACLLPQTRNRVLRSEMKRRGGCLDDDGEGE
eukprot:TRINITY_DN18321_c0_g1_i1.p1 TRINITY_DN18321_c0_g1~~TRINITY_DN18321_c0_g1_i1.p1  ORF type:complete len:310 (+),score=24.90 TRINITY_DN18321_c0_g1_i1:112-1041(+)